jgi:tRNA uracil 4-sulfurtransferase
VNLGFLRIFYGVGVYTYLGGRPVDFLLNMKGILLLSGGIDSPVAGHLMLRQGIDVVAAHMDARPHSDEAGLEKAWKLANKLGVRLIVVPYARFHEEASKHCKAKLHCILCKRFMYRAAEALSVKEGADFIISGESLGQVASQTLDNLKILNAAVRKPVLRPLIGFDKEDTIKIARELGTFDISSQKSCGCPFVPNQPSTKAKLEDVICEEGKIDIQGLVDEAVNASKVA